MPKLGGNKKKPLRSKKVPPPRPNPPSPLRSNAGHGHAHTYTHTYIHAYIHTHTHTHYASRITHRMREIGERGAPGIKGGARTRIPWRKSPRGSVRGKRSPLGVYGKTTGSHLGSSSFSLFSMISWIDVHTALFVKKARKKRKKKSGLP